MYSKSHDASLSHMTRQTAGPAGILYTGCFQRSGGKLTVITNVGENFASLSLCNSCFKTNWHPLKRKGREKRYMMAFICRHLVASKKVFKLKHLKDVLNVLLLSGSWFGVFKAAPCSSSGLRLTLCFFICWRRRNNHDLVPGWCGLMGWVGLGVSVCSRCLAL